MTETQKEPRKANYPITPLILERWSSRAMSGEAISKEELMAVFEAARWAPSSYNNQPWRFIYALRGTPHFDKFLEGVNEGNRVWAKQAAVLCLLVSKNTFDHNGKFAKTHSFDSGMAAENLALEAFSRGLVVHPIQGFDDIAMKNLCKVTDDHTVEIMIVIGKPGSADGLPDSLRSMESPNGRKPLEEIVFEGSL